MPERRGASRLMSPVKRVASSDGLRPRDRQRAGTGERDVTMGLDPIG